MGPYIMGVFFRGLNKGVIGVVGFVIIGLTTQSPIPLK